jgi:DNA-binding XRE family transcriptional regulator
MSVARHKTMISQAEIESTKERRGSFMVNIPTARDGFTDGLASCGDRPFDLAGVGEFLKTMREKKGLELAHLAEALLVKKSTIHAIESGVWNRLPHSLYVKGYVRSYARYMDVQPEVERLLNNGRPPCCVTGLGGNRKVLDGADRRRRMIAPIRSLWLRTVAFCQPSVSWNAFLACSSVLGIVVAVAFLPYMMGGVLGMKDLLIACQIVVLDVRKVLIS